MMPTLCHEVIRAGAAGVVDVCDDVNSPEVTRAVAAEVVYVCGVD